jgi:multimeric flavodoxin WrbA
MHMHILAFNGSPRKSGNTSTLIKAVLEGARSAGAETTEVSLHHINMKGCAGCLTCREKTPGECAQKDDLSPYLEAIKTCDGVVLGCPIYMYRLSGQMKLFLDRAYSLYLSKPEGGGYTSAVPAGKAFGLVVSQGAPDPEQYARSVGYLAGMGGTGYGMEETGRIIHCGGRHGTAKENEELLEQARQLGRKMANAS